MSDHRIVCPVCSSTNWRCYDEQARWFKDKRTDELFEDAVGYLACRDCQAYWRDSIWLGEPDIIYLGSYDAIYGFNSRD